MTLTTPVIFIIFARPDLTARVFQAIAQARPKVLLVLADGPRFPEEKEKCLKARRVLDNVDWECEVLTNFADTNLGSKSRVASGLDWAFSIVEEAIILEDDCLPAPSFFNYCQTLLEYYRHDGRIMHISGNNFQFGRRRTPYSYYFSKYTHNWGWATWRRAWKYFDVDMKSWPEFKSLNIIHSLSEDANEQRYWIDIFDRTYAGSIQSWDFQWLYTCWIQNALSILPHSNLVSNLGFRSDATHTSKRNVLAQLPTVDIWNIVHPTFVVRNREADNYTFESAYGGSSMREKNTPTSKIRTYLKRVARKLCQYREVP